MTDYSDRAGRANAVGQLLEECRALLVASENGRAQLRGVLEFIELAPDSLDGLAAVKKMALVALGKEKPW